jgi:DNA gyrase subunit A
MPLSRITQLEKNSLKSKISSLKNEMSKKEDVIASKDNINNYIINKLREVKKQIGDERKTKVIEKTPDKIKISDLLNDQEVVVIYTRDGYIKRSPLSDYKTFKTKGSKGNIALTTKEEDDVSFFDVAFLSQDILFFTESCKMYYKSVHQVPEFGRKARGIDAKSLLGVEEKISYLLPLNEEEAKKYLVFVTKQGYIKKTAIEEYNMEEQRRGLLGMRLKEDDEIIDIFKANDDDEVLIVSSSGFVNRFKIDNVNDTKRKTQGVQCINLPKKDCVISSHITFHNKGLYLVTASEKGKVKKTMLSEYTTYSGRVNKGLTGVKIQNNDKLAGTVIASNNDDILLITSNGKTLRYNCDKIKHTGRNTQGISLINIDKKSTVVGITNIKSIDEKG